MMKYLQILSIISICSRYGLYSLKLFNIPEVTTNWNTLTTDNIKFTPRNSHATCVFNGYIWLTGGRTDAYTTYNLLSSYKTGDVWRSTDGKDWDQITDLRGDYWAQNTDVMQPGPIAPWYERYGHSLNALDIDNDGIQDVMILMGGYSPTPSNDVWITEDGITWVYAGLAPWSGRAWHGTAVFNHTLWLVGGAPLNNEVWCLKKVTRIAKAAEPLTRSMKANLTFSMEWEQYDNAPWQPRAGMGLVSHWYFNHTATNYTSSIERLVMIAGFGGYPDPPLFDGFHGRSDVWYTIDGNSWELVTDSAAFGQRAWFGTAVVHKKDPRIDIAAGPVTAFSNSRSPRIFLFGGGDVGSSVDSNKNLDSVNGRMDSYWSRDLMTWRKVNYEEGGGLTGEGVNAGTPAYVSRKIPWYSSQEWAKTTVNSETVYLGMWGLTVVSFNTTTKEEHPGSLLLIGGLRSGSSGSRSSAVYQSDHGLLCDSRGVACNYRGTCGEEMSGCKCNPTFSGEYCEISADVSAGNSLYGMRNNEFSSNSILSIGLVMIVTLFMLSQQ